MKFWRTAELNSGQIGIKILAGDTEKENERNQYA